MNSKCMFFVLIPLYVHTLTLSFKFTCLMECSIETWEQVCSHCFPGVCYVSLNSGNSGNSVASYCFGNCLIFPPVFSIFMLLFTEDYIKSCKIR